MHLNLEKILSACYTSLRAYVPDFKMKFALSITQVLCASLRKFEN